jgi:hypothetical protein
MLEGSDNLPAYMAIVVVTYDQVDIFNFIGNRKSEYDHLDQWHPKYDGHHLTGPEDLFEFLTDKIYDLAHITSPM